MLAKKNRDSQKPSVIPCNTTAPSFDSKICSESRSTMMSEFLSAVVFRTSYGRWSKEF